MNHPLALHAVIFDLRHSDRFLAWYRIFRGSFSFRGEIRAAPARFGASYRTAIRQIFAHLLPDISEQRLSNLESSFRASYDSAGWRKTMLHEDAAVSSRSSSGRAFNSSSPPINPPALLGLY